MKVEGGFAYAWRDDTRRLLDATAQVRGGGWGPGEPDSLKGLARKPGEPIIAGVGRDLELQADEKS
jgi:hypothetical protein